MPPATDQQAEVAEEQSGVDSADQAGDDGSGVDEQVDSAGDSTDTDDQGAEDLIGQAQFDKLKNDPVALRKELNRAATKKFQALSAEKKRLAPYADFIGELENDPRAAITAVARQLGIEIPSKTRTEAEAAAAADTLTTKITAAIKKGLGPDYDDLSDKLGMAIHDAIQIAVPELTKPIQDRLDGTIQDVAMREAAAATEAFGKKYPDWKQHEEAMVKLSEKMPAGPGMDELEYLENLYMLVTRDKATGEGVKKIVARMAKSAAKGSSDNTEMSDSHVSDAPAKPPTFREAYAAAKRGQRIE